MTNVISTPLAAGACGKDITVWRGCWITSIKGGFQYRDCTFTRARQRLHGNLFLTHTTREITKAFAARPRDPRDHQSLSMPKLATSPVLRRWALHPHCFADTCPCSHLFLTCRLDRIFRVKPDPGSDSSQRWRNKDLDPVPPEKQTWYVHLHSSPREDVHVYSMVIIQT